MDDGRQEPAIRLDEKKPTGLRFVHWIHQDPREATRADAAPGAWYVEGWMLLEPHSRGGG